REAHRPPRDRGPEQDRGGGLRGRRRHGPHLLRSALALLAHRPVRTRRRTRLAPDAARRRAPRARRRAGGALVVRGEPGIGKSAIVDAVIPRAEGFTVLRTLGVEAEHTWSYAGLQMLLHPLLHRIGNLPAAQAEALRTALGMGEGTGRAQRLQVGLAVLNLLVDASAQRPVYVVIDDAHWLDRDSTDALLFAARRLTTESIGMVLVVRDGFAPEFPAPGIPELTLGPLDIEASQAILDTRSDVVPFTSRDWIL